MFDKYVTQKTYITGDNELVQEGNDIARRSLTATRDIVNTLKDKNEEIFSVDLKENMQLTIRDVYEQYREEAERLEKYYYNITPKEERRYIDTCVDFAGGDDVGDRLIRRLLTLLERMSVSINLRFHYLEVIDYDFTNYTLIVRCVPCESLSIRGRGLPTKGLLPVKVNLNGRDMLRLENILSIGKEGFLVKSNEYTINYDTFLQGNIDLYELYQYSQEIII